MRCFDMHIPIDPEKIVIDTRAMNGYWCTLPYPNHKNGCPNYGNKQGCPPLAHTFHDMIENPFYLVIQEFDLLAHVQKMKTRHPEWTERQCRNVLYWQKRVVKLLREKSWELARKKGGKYIVLEIPEANGVNVFKTCLNIGIELETFPQNIIRKVMIVGQRKE